MIVKNDDGDVPDTETEVSDENIGETIKDLGLGTPFPSPMHRVADTLFRLLRFSRTFRMPAYSDRHEHIKSSDLPDHEPDVLQRIKSKFPSMLGILSTDLGR